MTGTGAAKTSQKPLPYPDPLTEGFWTSAAEGRLAIQYCSACNHYIHLPELQCPICGKTDLEFRPVSGRGRLYSYCIMQDVPTRGFEDLVPYVIGIVELEEQSHLLLLTNIVDTPHESLRVGMPVEVLFEELREGCKIPQFRAAEVRS